MTFGKITALAGGFAAATAFGVWLSPHVVEQGVVPAVDHEAATVEAPAVAQPVTQAPRQAAAAPPPRMVTTSVSASAPSLLERIRPLLNRGADMSVAAEGFRDGEQLAAVAHAARNTAVPFMLLKHHVLAERKTLSAAIRELSPRIDASVEATRAIAEARADIAALKRS